MKKLALLFVIISCFTRIEVAGQSVAVMQAQVKIVSGSNVMLLQDEANGWNQWQFIINSPAYTQIIADVVIPEEIEKPVPVFQAASKNGRHVLILDEEAGLDLSKDTVAISVHHL